MKKARINKDNYYLKIAEVVSIRSTCLKRNYGCVIVKNDEIISTGYNGSSRGEINCCDTGICNRLDVEHNSGNYSDCPAVHAEQNAMLSASRSEMIGATMYLYGTEYSKIGVPASIKNCEPCPICMRMIKNSGIERIINKDGILWERK